MKVETQNLEPDFTPYQVNIKIETKDEHEILYAIFSSSKERLCEFVKSRYGGKKFSDKQIDTITDQIYQSLKYEI